MSEKIEYPVILNKTSVNGRRVSLTDLGPLVNEEDPDDLSDDERWVLRWNGEYGEENEHHDDLESANKAWQNLVKYLKNTPNHDAQALYDEENGTDNAAGIWPRDDF